MKRNIKLILIAFTLIVASCTKKADVDAIEPKLPAIKLSSLGIQQSSPFSTATILQVNFGATTTNTKTGKFTVEILNGTSANSPVFKTITFSTWSGKDDTSVGTINNHSISYVLEPTTYANTNIYGGSILLKLSVLGLTPGTVYSLRATAYAADGTTLSAFTQTSFFKVI